MKKNLFSILLLVILLSGTVLAKKIQVENVDADDRNILYMGRVDRTNPKAVRFAWPGVSISATFEGTVCNLRLKDLASGTDNYGNPHHNYYNVIIDGRPAIVLVGDPSKEIYKIDTLKPGVHHIEIFKRTEGLLGESIFYGFQLVKGKKLIGTVTAARPTRIEFIGNSITCGYGNEGDNKECKFSGATENNYLAYGAITARKLDAEYVAVAFSGKGINMNYDKSTEETMPDLYDRTLPFDPDVKWDFEKWKPDIVVINLGTNDFAHQNPDSVAWVSRYIEFVKTIKGNYSDVQIICCVGPMMSDSWPVGNNALSTITRYIKAVQNHFVQMQDTKVHLFFFKPHSGNYGCDWHPGVKTHERMAEGLAGFIKEKILK